MKSKKIQKQAPKIQNGMLFGCRCYPDLQCPIEWCSKNRNDEICVDKKGNQCLWRRY